VKLSLLSVSLIATCIPLSACRHLHDSDVSKTKVVNGEYVHMSIDQRSAMHAVSVVATLENETVQRCSGLVIGPRHVVTAAHCLKGAKSVDVGKGAALRRLPGTKTAKFTPHPLWAGTYEHDIGIVTLTGELPDELGPAPLAKGYDLKVGDYVLLAGYGRRLESINEYGHLQQVWVLVNLLEPETKTFTIQPYTLKGACHGDSGGPTFVDLNGTLKVIGITSGPSVDAPCDVGHGSFVQVVQYQGWMKCAFAAAGDPLYNLADDESAAACLH